MAEEAKQPKVLSGSQLKFAEHCRNQWHVSVPNGVTPNDLLQPAFWAHVGLRLKVRDSIEVWADDGTWYCQLLVVDRDRTWAKAKIVLGPVDLTASVTEEQANAGYAVALFDVIHRGPRKWSVVRRSDKAVVHENEETRDGAEQWLAENAGTLKKAA